jgi:hypothetical protein
MEDSVDAFGLHWAAGLETTRADARRYCFGPRLQDGIAAATKSYGISWGTDGEIKGHRSTDRDCCGEPSLRHT